MTTTLTNVTFGGQVWTPQFVQSINEAKCIGCGRCTKACGRGVLLLKALNEDGEWVEDEDEDEVERKVMTIANQDACIGCQACSRVCPKNCYTHASIDLN
jgi:Nif-specific ferredoxin III